MNILWSPGQSPALKNCLDQLNPSEKRTVAALGGTVGLCSFCLVALLIQSALTNDLYEGWSGGLLLALLIGLALAVYSATKMQWRLLLNTQFAKDEGYTINDLCMRTPLSSSDRLTIGITISLALILFAFGACLSFLSASDLA